MPRIDSYNFKTAVHLDAILNIIFCMVISVFSRVNEKYTSENADLFLVVSYLFYVAYIFVFNISNGRLLNSLLMLSVIYSCVSIYFMIIPAPKISIFNSQSYFLFLYWVFTELPFQTMLVLAMTFTKIYIVAYPDR